MLTCHTVCDAKLFVHIRCLCTFMSFTQAIRLPSFFDYAHVFVSTYKSPDAHLYFTRLRPTKKASGLSWLLKYPTHSLSYQKQRQAFVKHSLKSRSGAFSSKTFFVARRTARKVGLHQLFSG